MKTLLLGLVTLLAPRQDPAPLTDAEDGLAALLLTDVRAWLRAAEPPLAADIQALLDEAARLGAASVPARERPIVTELVREIGNLGHQLGQGERDQEARALVGWAGERALESGDLATASWALDWLAQEAWVRGELDAAAEWLARAAEADELRRAPLARTRHLADIARLRLTQGRFEQALHEITRAEEAARSAGSDAALRMAAEVHGSLLFELGRHREALELCLGSTGESVRDEAQVRLDILAADVLADVGRLESAAVFARRAHEAALEPAVARVAPLLHLEAKLTLGLLLGDLGRCDEALALLDGAAAEFARLGDARGAGWAAKNRGFALFAAGRWSESLPAFESAWRAGAELGVPFLEGLGALGVAEALVLGTSATAAPARLDESRLGAALATAERVADALHERTLQWRSAALRGRMHLARGAHAEALAELRRAVALVERWRRRLGTSGLLEHALRLRSDPYRDAAFAAARLGRAEEALGYAGLLQARVLDGLRARRDGPLPSMATPELAAMRERIARLEHRLRQADGAERGTLRAELELAEDELDTALLTAELASGRTLAAPDERLPLEQLGSALARQGCDVALAYLVGAEECLVLRIEPGPPARVEERFLAIGRERLARCSERVQAPIARLEAGELDLLHLAFDLPAARELHDALVRPLALPQGARLALLTDGVLGGIPFELFVSAGELGAFDLARPFAHLDGLRFLGDEHALVSFGSLARLASLGEARVGEAVVFLAPAAHGLAHATEEARAITRALRGARTVPEADLEAVARESRGAALVHFAAHGRIDPERPAHGHLVLGGPGGTSARLESWQAAELELDGALVVLSACHSGRGEWLAGAGLAGLSRGFLLAGAREVVASRWAVDDRVTARFMELFYAELARGSATAEALRAARTGLRAESDPRGFALAHPAFWAGWSVQR